MYALAGKRFLTRLRDEVKGATAIEYGLIAALIAIVVLFSTGSLGNAMDLMYEMILGSIEDAAPAAATE